MSVTYRTCHLCEATCGLEIHHEGRRISLVRGDRDDVFSGGFICPKGASLGKLEDDPDRLQNPLLRHGETWEEIVWDDAWKLLDERLRPIVDRHGPDSVGVFLGNPNAHTLAGMLYGRVLLQALRTRNVFTAGTLDQVPKQVAAGLMFGGGLTIPIPDVDRTHYLLVLGANPYESNGSLLTAPDLPGRLRRLRERGGRVVVVDPRRTKTADNADEHVFIRPGTDAHMLWGIVHTLFDEDLVDLGHADGWVSGVRDVRESARDLSPDAMAPRCGVSADTIRRLARELAGAPSAAVYGRIGTCTQEFGTQASWLVDVCNVLTGNLDRAGGVMFPSPATEPTGSARGRGRGLKLGRRASRVRGEPERLGELPAVCMAEEITTPGEGQIRALVTIAGNPVLSAPDGPQLSRALDELELMVSVDRYLNETTRHADLILPPEHTLARDHYDLVFTQLAVRNVANWSAAAVGLESDEVPEWETLARLASCVAGAGAAAGPDAFDELAVQVLVQGAVARAGSNVFGRDPDELLAELSHRRGPARAVDFMIRTGLHGDGFGADPEGLTLSHLETEPHGIDLGALEPRLPDLLRTESGCVELAPSELLADVDRLRATLSDQVEDGMLRLVGRRDLRSNNSWMHNVEVLVKGRPRCTLQVHPSDAERLGLADGATARVSNETGSVEIPVEVTDAVMPGVVSVPHGWGHGDPRTRQSVAVRHAGVNSNLLAGTDRTEPLSGTAILTGIPVIVSSV